MKSACLKMKHAYLILGIDPGPVTSGFVFGYFYADGSIQILGGAPTIMSDKLIEMCADIGSLPYSNAATPPHVGIEWIQDMGMPAGASLFDTARIVGRMQQAAIQGNAPTTLIPRGEAKMHVCGNARAKDANIRQAMIDRYGPPGTTKKRGQTFGVASHAWQALAVATVLFDRLTKATP